MSAPRWLLTALSFAAMLGVFLAGLAVGSLAVGPLLSRAARPGRARRRGHARNLKRTFHIRTLFGESPSLTYVTSSASCASGPSQVVVVLLLRTSV